MRLVATITAHRRVKELRRAVEALSRSGVLTFVSVDGGEAESRDVYAAALKSVDCRRLNEPPFGLWGNPNNASATYDWAFSNTGAYAILAIEDDCVLASDALGLCLWFLYNEPSLEDYTFLSLANCNKPADCVGRELEVAEANCIDSPWAWCFTRRMWEERIRPQWNWRTETPVGWDWSLTDSMRSNGWKALCPVLPRAKNIGRELGANGGVEIFDQTLALAAFSDGSWGNNFRIVK